MVTIKQAWGVVRRYWQTSSRLRKYFGYGFHLVALIFMGGVLWQSLRILDFQDVRVNYTLVFIAFLCVFVVVLMGGLNWGLLTLLFRFDGTWLWHIRAHLVSNVSKYLPGSIWGYLSKGTLSAQAETSKQKIAGAMFLEIVLALASGIMAAFYTGADVANRLALPFHLPWKAWIVLGSLTVIVSYYGARFIVNRSTATHPDKSLKGSRETALLVSVIAIFALGWLLLALSLSWLVEAVYLQPSSSLSLYVFALSVSVVLGILTIFIPNGVGVREGILVLLLGNILPLSVAVLAALALRIAIVIGELVAFVLISAFFSRIMPK